MILAAVNVAVFFFLSFQGMTEDAGFMLEHGAMYVPLMLEQGKYSPLFTSMFLHFGFSHLVNNMVMLLVIGWNLELEIGRIKFVIIYFASGLCGNVASALWDFRTGDYAVSAGASGAIFGITGALSICGDPQPGTDRKCDGPGTYAYGGPQPLLWILQRWGGQFRPYRRAGLRVCAGSVVILEEKP